MSAIICPFCGKESASEDHCTKCRTRFTKEIRADAFTVDNDPRSDRIGPVLSLIHISGTDCALAMGMLRVIVDEDLYDHDFVDNWCYGFDELVERLQDYPCLLYTSRCV